MVNRKYHRGRDNGRGVIWVKSSHQCISNAALLVFNILLPMLLFIGLF